jgi:uncharacterized alkaline shock family protein YloU
MSSNTTDKDRTGPGATEGREQGERQSGSGPTRMLSRPQAPIAQETDQGNTRISADVVAKIAGLAARDIPGVQAMGSGIARRVGQLRSRIPGATEAASQGVSVEVGERQAAIDLNLVTWYGQSIVDISDAVRRSVVGQVEGMTGIRVAEVNIQIDDIHIETPQSKQSSSGQ